MFLTQAVLTKYPGWGLTVAIQNNEEKKVILKCIYTRLADICSDFKKAIGP
jgi:hypothetical protein